MVNRYAKDMTAAKYRTAVTMVNTMLSVASKGCIFSMQIWILG